MAGRATGALDAAVRAVADGTLVAPLTDCKSTDAVPGRPGPTSNPGRDKRVSSEGETGSGPEAGKKTTRDETGAATERVGVVKLANEPADSTDEAYGVPDAKQTAVTKVGKDGDSPTSEEVAVAARSDANPRNFVHLA